MKNNGLKQVEIAKRMNLTKSAVNQYIKNKRGNEIQLNENIKNAIKESSKRIINKIDTIREIQNLLIVSRKEKIACQLHKMKDKDFEDCNLCFDEKLIQVGVAK